MQVEIATTYHPDLTAWHVRHALNWIHPADLTGLAFIRLADENPEAVKARKKSDDIWQTTYNGMYFKKNGQKAAHIDLYTRDLYLGIPLLFRFTPVSTLRIAFTLAHEIGHHVITYRGYIYEPTEKYKPFDGTQDRYSEGMADSYAHGVIRKMLKNPYYKIGQLMSHGLARFFHGQGNVDWEDKNYKQAAYYWFCAYLLNDSNKDAAQFYLHAMKMLNQSKAQSNNSFNPSPR